MAAMGTGPIIMVVCLLIVTTIAGNSTETGASLIVVVNSNTAADIVMVLVMAILTVLKNRGRGMVKTEGMRSTKRIDGRMVEVVINMTRRTNHNFCLGSEAVAKDMGSS